MTEQVRIDLTATDKASDVIDDVADAAADLEKLTPEVTVTADTDNAESGIADVAADAEQLARTDAEIVLRAKIDAAKGNLAELRAELDRTGEKADTTARQLDRVDGPGAGGGAGLRGNAIADLTGPLGEASGAASDFAGVFDGLGDISESVAGKVGVSAQTMSTAIGGIGVAVAAAAAVWTLYRQRQEAARQRLRDLERGQRDFNRAVREGDRAAAAAKLVELYDDAYNAARRAGIGVDEFTRFLTGQQSTLPQLEQALADAADARDNFAESGKTIDQLNAQDKAVQDLADTLTGARDEYEATNGTIADQDRELSSVERALGKTGTATGNLGRDVRGLRDDVDDLDAAMGRIRSDLDIEQAALDFKTAVADAMDTAGEDVDDTARDVHDLKQTVVDVGEQLGKSPIQIQTELDKIDEGDLLGVRDDVNEWFRMNPVTIASKLDRPGQTTGTAGGGGVGPQSFEPAAASIGVLNMTLPAGWRGDPIRQAHVARRRSGRYFARS